MANYSAGGKGGNDKFFPGKIAVVTDHLAVNSDDFHSVDRLIAKYGAEKILHTTWPEGYLAEPKKMIEVITAFAEDREVKALIISQNVPGTNAAVDEFLKIRDDVFIVYCTIQEPTMEIVKRANLLFDPNHMGMGPAMVNQARKQGAKTFVHYSFPRHMAVTNLALRKDMILETCNGEGILFVDSKIPDPAVEIDKATRFILDDVPKMVSKYGDNTAFFCTNCHMQIPLIKAVVDCHAIYPQPCCPSPLHGFPEALGIKMEGDNANLNYVISEACRIAEEKNMTDRLSTWPVSASTMFTNAGAEYAISWINGDVPKKGIDNETLMKCMSSFVIEVVGEASNVYMTSCSECGIVYENFKCILMSYLDF